MGYLTDSMLIEVYQRAVDLRLEQDFIQLLQAEMMRRELSC